MKSMLPLVATIVALVALAMPAAAGAAWDAQTIGGSDACYYASSCGRVATDVDGNSYAIWTERVTGTQYLMGSLRPAGGSWGTPETIGVVYNDSLDAYPYALGWDGAGEVTVVWRGTSAHMYGSTRSAAGAWSSPADIGIGPSRTYPNYDKFPELEVNSAGEAVAAWTQGASPVAATRRGDGTWISAQALPNGSSKAIDVGIDESGEVTAVWPTYDSGTDLQHLWQTTWAAGDAVPASAGDLRPPVATYGDRAPRADLAVSPAGAAVAVASIPDPDVADVTTTEAIYRSADGTWESSPTPMADMEYGKIGIDADGDALLVSPRPYSARGYNVRRRDVLTGWSTMTEVTTMGSPIYYDVSVAADGTALVAFNHYDYSTSVGGAYTLTMAADGTWGTPQGPFGPANADEAIDGSVADGGEGAIIWGLGDGYSTWGLWVGGGVDDGVGGSTGGGGTDPGTGGDSGGSTGGSTGGDSGGSAPPPSTGESFNDALSASPQPPAPELIDTTETGKMPKVVGLRLDRAQDRIDRAGIQYSDIDVSWSRKAPRRFDRGDVVAQRPKPGTSVTGSIETAPRIRLSVYQGPKGIAGRKCNVSSLSKDLKGADYTLVEDLLAKTKCKTNWNVKLSSRADESELSRLTGTGRRVTASITCPKSSADMDLFAFVRPYGGQLTFGAEDWALTASSSQRNFVRLTVVQRGGYLENGTIKGQLVKNARLIIDTSDVGGTDARAVPTDGEGTTTFTLMAPKPGKVDVCIIGEASDGNVVYGSTQLTVVKRTTDFDAVGGNHMKKTSFDTWKDAALKDAPILIKESAHVSGEPTARASLDIFGPLVSAVQRLVQGFSGQVTQVVNNVTSSAQVTVKTVQNKLQFTVGQFGFGQAIGGQPDLIKVVPGQLIGQAGTNVIAAGGGNVIAAGGGNVIAAGGGNLIGQAGTNAIAAGGGNVIAAGGGNFLAGFTDLRQARVIAAGGGNVIAAGGGNVIAAGGGNVIAAGGGNVIAAGGYN